MSDTGYTLIYEPDSAAKASVAEFKTLLEKSKEEVKIQTMKRIILAVLNGDSMPDLLMHVIRFVMPSKNKELKKLLYFYWEVCPKLDEHGKMRHEIILVCNAIQHDLQHPNEYVRGNTLRFLCKLKEPELLETLVPNVRQCLMHRHAYVRKNAVFAVYSIYKVSEHLLPDAPDLIQGFLAEEIDPVCKRNAFVCLGELNREATLQYVQENLPQLETLDSLLQLAFVEFVRRDAQLSLGLKSQYVQLLSDIIESSSNVVVYEAAMTLTVLSALSQLIVLAANKFVELALKELDNNVKIITLDRINDLNKAHPGLLLGLSLDVLGVLASQDIDVRRRALDVSLTLVSSRNVEDIVKLLKKELQKASLATDDSIAEYRLLLINAIHQLAISFGEVAANVIDLLLESIGELTATAAHDVVSFVKEVVEKFPQLRDDVVAKLIKVLPDVKSGRVMRGALWILGEYALTEPLVRESWKFIRGSVGEVPILASEQRGAERQEPQDEPEATKSKGPVVLPDGTYATELAFVARLETEEESEACIRKLVLEGDFYLAAVLSLCLVKLVLRLVRLEIAEKQLNALKAEALLIMVSFIRVGESDIVTKKIDEDSGDRILACIRFLNADEGELVSKGFLDDTKEAYKTQIARDEAQKQSEKALEFQSNADAVDDTIVFRQFESNAPTSQDDISLATGTVAAKENLSSRLNKILQLTGFSDPIYAEAYVKVHQYDVTLDILLVNQTTQTLRNLNVEFATLGDLKLVDKPATANIGPHGFHKMSATVKVSSADTGVIFGNIVYDGQHSDDTTIVILNHVQVDIMDYIRPATCSESAFRKMWNEFEWENKITVKALVDSLKLYLETLMKGTNMRCLTPGAVVGQECQFLAANLYSRSLFGEDALANLSIEKLSDGPVVGHVRIRSRSQGLALSLGDRVAAISKKVNTASVVKV